MADLYFDITDLIAYASVHATVSGIQRVEIRLLTELSRAVHSEGCRCVAVDPSGRGLTVWRLSDIVAGIEHEGVGIFARLADQLADGSRRHVVRRRLNQLGLRGWRRAVGKIGLHARMLFETAAPAAGIAGTHLQSLPRDATFVVLGAGWNQPRIADVAAAHGRSGGRVVQCVYDLIPIVRPEYFNDGLVRAFSQYLARAAEHVSEFVCISRHTQHDLERYLGDRGRRTPSAVVQLAHEFHGFGRNARGCRPDDDSLRDFGGPDREFLLNVGTLEIRKNGLALLEAWLRLRDRLGEATPHLVLCGRRGWKVDRFFNLLESHAWLQGRVHILSSATDNDIAYLHERSLCSIYPSLYEGWGLPIGEAAWFGRTCITAANSSLPEVCGLLADYVDPHDPDDIAEQVLRNVVDRERLRSREKLLESVRLRTWRQVAGEVHGILHGADSRLEGVAASPTIQFRRAA